MGPSPVPAKNVEEESKTEKLSDESVTETAATVLSSSPPVSTSEETKELMVVAEHEVTSAGGVVKNAPGEAMEDEVRESDLQVQEEVISAQQSEQIPDQMEGDFGPYFQAPKPPRRVSLLEYKERMKGKKRLPSEEMPQGDSEVSTKELKVMQPLTGAGNDRDEPVLSTEAQSQPKSIEPELLTSEDIQSAKSAAKLPVSKCASVTLTQFPQPVTDTKMTDSTAESSPRVSEQHESPVACEVFDPHQSTTSLTQQIPVPSSIEWPTIDGGETKKEIQLSTTVSPMTPVKPVQKGKGETCEAEVVNSIQGETLEREARTLHETEEESKCQKDIEERAKDEKLCEEKEMKTREEREMRTREEKEKQRERKEEKEERESEEKAEQEEKEKELEKEKKREENERDKWMERLEELEKEWRKKRKREKEKKEREEREKKLARRTLDAATESWRSSPTFSEPHLPPHASSPPIPPGHPGFNIPIRVPMKSSIFHPHPHPLSLPPHNMPPPQPPPPQPFLGFPPHPHAPFHQPAPAPAPFNPTHPHPHPPPQQPDVWNMFGNLFAQHNLFPTEEPPPPPPRSPSPPLPPRRFSSPHRMSPSRRSPPRRKSPSRRSSPPHRDSSPHPSPPPRSSPTPTTMSPRSRSHSPDHSLFHSREKSRSQSPIPKPRTLESKPRQLDAKQFRIISELIKRTTVKRCDVSVQAVPPRMVSEGTQDGRGFRLCSTAVQVKARNYDVSTQADIEPEIHHR